MKRSAAAGERAGSGKVGRVGVTVAVLIVEFGVKRGRMGEVAQLVVAFLVTVVVVAVFVDVLAVVVVVQAVVDSQH